MDKIYKLEERLDKLFELKNYYEAHQICRTIYYRLVKLQKYEKMFQFLYSASFILVEANEFNSAADLSQLLVDAFCKKKLLLDDEHSLQLMNVLNKIPSEYFGGCDIFNQLYLLNKASSKPESSINTLPVNSKLDRKEIDMDLD